MRVQCFEPSAQPRRVVLDVVDGAKITVYAIQDLGQESTRGLRMTVMRMAEQTPPANSVLVMQVDIRVKRPGEAPVFRVVGLHRHVSLEWLRDEGRSRVTRGNELPNGARYEVTLPDLRNVIFSLEVEAEVAQGAGISVGSRGGGGGGADNLHAGLWMIPSVMGVLADPVVQVKAQIQQRLRSMGISASLLSPTILSTLFMAGSGVFAYMQWDAKKAVQEEMAVLQVELDGAKSGMNAALASESACVEERKQLSTKLDDLNEARKLQAEVALAVPLAQSIAVEVGGAKMAEEDALAYDAVAVDNTHKLVVGEMGKKRPKLNDPSRCLAQEAPLGQDLPRFLLFWHPDREYQCPEEYATSDGIVDRAGPWGLSTRAGFEFGAPSSRSDDDEDAEDSRMNYRWSAHAMTNGVRVIVNHLLEADTGDRPPVAPGQTELWGLAVWDAYNRLPSPADGAMDKSALQCVDQLMQQVLRGQGPAEPGQPVLPDLSRVAMGDGITLTPTAGCPWPADALTQGAQNAIEAVTRQAVYELELEAGGGDEG